MLLRRDTDPVEDGVPKSSSVLRAERSVRCRISDRRGVLLPEGESVSWRAESGLAMSEWRMDGEAKLGVTGERLCCEPGDWMEEEDTCEFILSRMCWLFSRMAVILLLRRCRRASAESSAGSSLVPRSLAGNVLWLAAESALRLYDAPLSLPPAALVGLSGRLPIEFRNEGDWSGDGLVDVGDRAADEGLPTRSCAGEKLSAAWIWLCLRDEVTLDVRWSADEAAPLLRREPGGEAAPSDVRWRG